MAKQNSSGHTAKHSKTKHRATAKHHPNHQPQSAMNPIVTKTHVVAKHPAHPKPKRAFSYNSEFPVCVPDAIAASLYLATGYKATEEDILTLYFAVNPADDGMTIADGMHTLMLAGMAGFKPISCEIVSKIEPGVIIGTHIPEGSHALTLGNDGVYSWGTERHMIFSPEEIWRVCWQ